MDVFAEIKERLPIIDVFNAYGVHVNSHNLALCPLHQEHTASFRVYPGSNSWFCFGCQAGGSAIDFVAYLFGLEPLDAARKLDEDFNLGLMGEELSAEEKQQIKARQKEQKGSQQLLKAFNAWENDYFDMLCARLNLLEELEKALRPKTPDNFTDEWAAAVNQLQLAKYEWDILFYGDVAEKLALYKALAVMEKGEAVA